MSSSYPLTFQRGKCSPFIYLFFNNARLRYHINFHMFVSPSCWGKRKFRTYMSSADKCRMSRRCEHKRSHHGPRAYNNKSRSAHNALTLTHIEILKELLHVHEHIWLHLASSDHLATWTTWKQKQVLANRVSPNTGVWRLAEAPRLNSQPLSGKDEEPQNGGDPTTEDRSRWLYWLTWKPIGFLTSFLRRNCRFPLPKTLVVTIEFWALRCRGLV
jgi:hypothetical protein